MENKVKNVIENMPYDLEIKSVVQDKKTVVVAYKQDDIIKKIIKIPFDIEETEIESTILTSIDEYKKGVL